MTTVDDDGPIAPLTRPEDAPQVQTDDQLRQRWRSLMGADGFDLESLYLIWFDAEGTQLPCVVPFDDLDEQLDVETVGNLMMIAEAPVADIGGCSIAMALTRPGSSVVTEVDRGRARALIEGSRSLRQKVWPLHLATENSVRQLTGDDVLPAG